MSRVVLGITGGIAAYKAPELVRLFTKAGIDVSCVLTREAQEFVTPLTLRTLSGNPVYTDLFFESKNPSEKITHISLAQNCDLVVIAPATANIIGKIACGIADDLLTTVVMSTDKKVLIAPAMNTKMWENPVVVENSGKLKKLGYIFCGPKKGELACGDTGIGHIEDINDIFSTAVSLLKKKAKIKQKKPSL
jgi:phosphopantothenoylcysteine decarboxylase / phosphopantothenate---cysteine ligase